MLYIKRSRLKSLLGGWMAGKARLSIAYSNQKYFFCIKRSSSGANIINYGLFAVIYGTQLLREN
jgi:hypothetical protein